MNTVQKIVGINLFVMFVYGTAGSFMHDRESIVQLGLMSMAGTFHFIVCLIIAFNAKGDTKDKTQLYEKGFVLSALIVLVVGLSYCSCVFC